MDETKVEPKNETPKWIRILIVIGVVLVLGPLILIFVTLIWQSRMMSSTFVSNELMPQPDIDIQRTSTPGIYVRDAEIPTNTGRRIVNTPCWVSRGGQPLCKDDLGSTAIAPNCPSGYFNNKTGSC